MRAAAALDTTLGAIRGQLERGRKRLEARLRKRGITLSAGLFSTFFGSSTMAGGPSSVLIQATIHAASGQASAGVASLAKGVFSIMTLVKSSICSAILLVGLISAGLGWLGRETAPASGETHPAPQRQLKKEMQKNSPDRIISGKVLDADGKPLQAELSLVWIEGKPQSLGKSNVDGTFQVKLPTHQKNDRGWLIAQSPGYGFDFRTDVHDGTPASISPEAEIVFRLIKERRIKGRVVDVEGKEVRDAKITLLSVDTFDNEKSIRKELQNWATEGIRNAVDPRGDRRIYFRDETSQAQIASLVKIDVTGGDFEIRGIGPSSLIKLKIRGKGYADEKIMFLNQEGFDPAPWNETARKTNTNRSFRVEYLLSPNPTVVLEPEKIIRGTLSDEDGKPRAGVRVVFSRPNERDINRDYNMAITDANGKYEIRGARKHKGYMVECPPDNQAGLMECQGFADDTPGYESIEINLKCRRGVILTGTVRDKATGKPIEGFFSVQPLAKNLFVEKYPPFFHRVSSLTEANRTDEQGRFRVVTVPGKVILMFGPENGPDGRKYRPAALREDSPEVRFGQETNALIFPEYRGGAGFVQGSWYRTLDLKETEKEHEVTVELEPATRHPVQVTDLEGKKLTGIYATGVTHLSYDWPKRVPEGEELTILNLDPKKGRLIAAYHPTKKLVGTLKLTSEEKNPTIKLGPGGTVTGRILDSEGKPIPNVRVELNFSNREIEEAYRGLHKITAVETDQNGQFRFEQVFPDEKFYYAVLTKPATVSINNNLPAPGHGKTLDLGDLAIGKMTQESIL
jgi:protocatechuate 3,4-dioxygenase beta subunit